MDKKLSIAFALGLSLFSTFGCYNSKKADSTVADSPVSGKSEMSTEASPEEVKLRVPRVATGDLWKHLPAETEIVVTIDIEKVVHSDLWKQYGTQIFVTDNKIQLVNETCGFDLFKTLQWVSIGYESDKDQEPVVLIRGVERSVASTCIVAVAESEGEKIELSEEGAFTIIKSDKEGKSQMMAWIDDMTVIMVPKKMDKDYLMARMAGTTGLRDNEAMMETMDKAKRDAPIWFAASLKNGSKAAELVKDTGKDIRGFFGGFGLQRGVEISLGAEFGNEEDAKFSKSKVEQMLPMGQMLGAGMGPIIEKIKVALAGNDLTIDADLATADIATIVGLVGPMLGGIVP